MPKNNFDRPSKATQDQITSFVGSIAAGLVVGAGKQASQRVLGFFDTVKNPNTRRVYIRAIEVFLVWCSAQGVASVNDIQSLHVIAYIEMLSSDGTVRAATVNVRLAALRRFFDWIVQGDVGMAASPAASIQGPASDVIEKTPGFGPREARRLLDSIDTDAPIDLRDRALIALMVYSFARIGVAVALNVQDVFLINARLWVRLHKDSDQERAIPCHSVLEAALRDYMRVFELDHVPEGPLFRSFGPCGGPLTKTRLHPDNAYQMVRRRALAAGLKMKINTHTFRATGLVAYLANDGTLKNAATMANHSRVSTTERYGKRPVMVGLDEVERIGI